MKLSEFMEKPLQEALKELNLVELKPFTDASGEVLGVSLIYKNTSIQETEEDSSYSVVPKKRRA